MKDLKEVDKLRQGQWRTLEWLWPEFRVSAHTLKRQEVPNGFNRWGKKRKKNHSENNWTLVPMFQYIQTVGSLFLEVFTDPVGESPGQTGLNSVLPDFEHEVGLGTPWGLLLSVIQQTCRISEACSIIKAIWSREMMLKLSMSCPELV